MSETRRPSFVSVDGRLVPYSDATVHVLSAAFKYGIIVFEGLRAYWNSEREALLLFRVDDHLHRLYASAAGIGFAIPCSLDQLRNQLVNVVRANDLHEDLHIRVQAFATEDDGRMATVTPVSVTIAPIPMERYFVKQSLAVGVSSWARISDRSMPPRIKAVPNYHNSRLALLDARRAGYDDAILLNDAGHVTEGPGYNIFMLRRGVLCTPPVTDNILEGVTRDSLLRLAAAQPGLQVAERSIDRTELYSCDELFFCGSAAELTPIASVDGRPVRDDAPGPVTSKLQKAYGDIASGRAPDVFGWTTEVTSASES